MKQVLQGRGRDKCTQCRAQVSMSDLETEVSADHALQVIAQYLEQSTRKELFLFKLLQPTSRKDLLLEKCTLNITCGGGPVTVAQQARDVSNMKQCLGGRTESSPSVPPPHPFGQG